MATTNFRYKTRKLVVVKSWLQVFFNAGYKPVSQVINRLKSCKGSLQKSVIILLKKQVTVENRL